MAMTQRPVAGSTPGISLGPVLYYWPRERILEFYREVEQLPVDTVYLGETVCSKRRALRFGEWMELAIRLEQQGKQVVLSTLSLIEAASELGAVRRICENGRFAVEANDMAAVRMLAARGAPFCTGPSINIYNPRTLSVLAADGLMRWVLPVELSRESLADLQRDRPAGVETEVFAFGRLPLAWSARCYTARALNLAKDDCGFRCLDYPDGMLLSTREDQPLFAFNGVQTQSAQTFNLLGELGTLKRLGVERIRISPQSSGTGAIVRAFRAALDGQLVDNVNLEQWMPEGACDGYWRGAAGMLAAVPGDP